MIQINDREESNLPGETPDYFRPYSALREVAHAVSIASAQAAGSDFLLRVPCGRGGGEGPSQGETWPTLPLPGDQVAANTVSQAAMIRPPAALLSAPAAPDSLGKGLFFINTNIFT